MSASLAAAPTEPLPRSVYDALSDRAFHSGTALATRCAVTRSAVWKAVSALRTLGVDIEAVRHRGYRLRSGGALLDAARIAAWLPSAVASRVRAIDAVWCTGSTNADLLQRKAPPPGCVEVRTAEHQSAGRGRRARRWYAPPGGALCLSLSWSFSALPPDLGALSLAIGVCALRALAGLGMRGVSLKWPNDLVVGAGKLGGILVELRAEAGGPALAVIGIGINVAIGRSLAEQVSSSGTRPADLASLGAGACDRDRLAAALVAECVTGLEQFERSGFRGFLAEWRDADALAGHRVVVHAEQGAVHGHARGIDAGGALCVQTRDGLQRFLTGDVSVRTAA